MRIALIWNSSYAFSESSAPYVEYYRGLTQLGHEVQPFYRAGSEDKFPFPVKLFHSESEISNSEYWAQAGCDLAVLFTWHQMTDVLQALLSAGVPVLAIGDSDAQLSPRYHPWATFRYMTFLQSKLQGKLGAAKHWLQRFLFQADKEHQSLIKNTSSSSILTLAGQEIVDEFRHLLRRIGSSELDTRVAWLPYPVPELFCVGQVNLDRPRRMIAVGRWIGNHDSPQKNPGLLARTIAKLHASGDQTEFLIVGRGSEQMFAALAENDPLVHRLGIQSREQVRELMLGCRAVLIPSRWESGPIVANEMLASGGSVVGTPIPGLRGIVADGRFGRVSRSHTSTSLAFSVRTEMDAWDRGERDPSAIAAHWRGELRPTAVAKKILELLVV